MTKLQDLDVRGRRVLLRSSCNVPLEETGAIADDFRLRSSLSTIQDLVSREGKIVVIGHLGRPKGREDKLSLRPVAVRLGELIGQEVGFCEDTIGQAAGERVSKLKNGEVLMLENLRFHKGEEANDPDFVSQLAHLGDAYVNDAFEVSHREHASVVGLPNLLPSAIGNLFLKEIDGLSKLLENPAHPMVVIVGGSKVATKVAFLDKISKTADTILVANLVADYITNNYKQLLNTGKIIKAIDSVGEQGKELDIGPQTIKLFSSYIQKAKTIFWSGPLGQIEDEKYQSGSKNIAEAIISSGAYSVVGGGDLDAFLGKLGLRDQFSHASTGGGALMAYLAKETLPGLKALQHG